MDKSGIMNRTFCGDSSRGTVASDISCADLTLENMLAVCGTHYIEVPREPRAFSFGPLPDTPVLHFSGMCKGDEAYILAGFGIVAGKEAFGRLDGRSVLKWVDKFKND